MTQLKNVTIPDLGGAGDVTVIEMLVKVGDSVTVDTPVITLESDKATLEVPATVAGKIKEFKVKVGDKVSTGSLILTILSDESEAAPISAPIEKPESKSEEIKAQQPIIPEKKEEAPPILTSTVQATNDVHAGPGVRRLARELGVNLSQVLGSGPKQRILKEDVQLFVKGQLSQIQSGASQSFSAVPAIDFSQFGSISTTSLSRIKKISGKNLQRNWAMIPHVTQFGEADITDLEEFRKSQKEMLEKQKIKLTPLVFIIKAVIAALKSFPNFNASLDVTGEQLIIKNYFHIGVAVDTPDGLVVPVIRDADKKGMTTLATELAEISEKARKKQLLPKDMQGGCFSISSLGGIGGTAFTPIINHPEVAILGVSKSFYKPVYQNNTFVPRLMLPLSLSYDHRVIDGADGARFIVHLSTMLSDIRNLLL